MIFRIMYDYFLYDINQLVTVMETLCFLRGRNWIFKYLDELIASKA
jgi:hypothetical protein